MTTASTARPGGRSPLSRLDDVGLAKKLLGVVALGLLAMLAVGLIGSRGIGAVSDASDTLVADDALPAIDLATTANEWSMLRRNMVALSQDEDRVAAAAQSVRELRAAVAQGLEDYQRTATAQQREEITRVRGLLTQALQVYDQQIAPITAGGSITLADLTQLDTVVEERFAPIANQIRDAFTGLVEGNKRAIADRLAQQRDEGAAAVRLVWIVTVLAAILLFGAVTALSRRIVRPVAEVRDALTALADGDLRPDVRYRAGDEVGAMAEALRRAQGALRNTMESVTRSAGSLNDSAGELSGVTAAVSRNAEETSAQSLSAASGAEQVSRNVQTVSAATEEMTASIREISVSSTEALRVAGSAVAEAGEVNATVAKLGDSSSEIADVIKVITSIAEQTNLLALNATIEAARAGDAGRGFAVVAEEVKQLAQETARATDDISGRIEAIQGDSAAAVEAITRISQTIQEINQHQTVIAAAVEEQTATTQEMARSIAEAAGGSTEIARSIEGVASAARSSSEGVNDARRTTDRLTELSGELRRAVSGFRV